MSDEVLNILENNKNTQEKPDTRMVKENNAERVNADDVKISIKTNRLQEDDDDARHSKENTEKVNKIYSQLICLFFGGWWFYLIVLVVFGCYVMKNNNFANTTGWEIAGYLSEKIPHFFGFVFMVLLSFPTAKGVRRLFREIILNISKKRESR